jgi:hypothetical protein
MFDRREEGRTKTGKAAIGTIPTRTERLLTSYLASREPSQGRHIHTAAT